MNSERTILVVEDEVLMRASVVGALKAAEFSVIEADNGKIGLELALEKHPDLILLDVAMPVLDGISVMRALRDDAWGSQARIILLTSLGNSDLVGEEVMKQKPIYCLLKDKISLSEVVQKVKEALQ